VLDGGKTIDARLLRMIRETGRLLVMWHSLKMRESWEMVPKIRAV